MRKFIITSIILVLILVWVQKCGRKDPPVNGTNTPSVGQPSKPVRIVFGDDEKKNLRETPKDKGDWKPGTSWNEYQGTVTDNNIHIALQPALGYLYDGRHRLDLDFRVVRWKNLGFNLGTGLGFNPVGAVGWGGVSYRLTNPINKVEAGLFVGVTTQKHFCAGLRITL